MSNAAVLLALIDTAADRLSERMVSIKQTGAVDGVFDGGMSRACREYVQRAHAWEEQRKAEAEQRFLRQQDEERSQRDADRHTLRRVVWREAKERSAYRMPLRSELVPEDLRAWAVQQLRWSSAVMTRVYVYLVLRDVIEHELAQRDPDSFGPLQGDYGEATMLATQARDYRDAPRLMRTEDEEGQELFVQVTDSPGRQLDLRGWDRPERSQRVLLEIVETAAEELEDDQRSRALRTKARRAPAEPTTPKARKPRRTFSQLFINSKRQVFELTERGWFYQHVRVSTAVSQRLTERKRAGQLRQVSL